MYSEHAVMQRPSKFEPIRTIEIHDVCDLLIMTSVNQPISKAEKANLHLSCAAVSGAAHLCR